VDWLTQDLIDFAIDPVNLGLPELRLC